MPEKEKKSYPGLSIQSWWMLRKKFKSTIPTLVNGRYLASVLKMDKKSAQSNVIPSLKVIELIDLDGKPTELVKKWRDDKQYSQVCKEILNKVYPKGLLEAVPDPSNNKDDAKRWFLSDTGVGSVAANKMTSFYTLLHEADIEGEKKIREVSAKPKRKKIVKKKEREKTEEKEKPGEVMQEEPKDEVTPTIQLPTIHLNVQIHLGSDASTDQIDQLFAGIAKHLKEFFPKKSK